MLSKPFFLLGYRSSCVSNILYIMRKKDTKAKLTDPTQIKEDSNMTKTKL